MEEATGSSGVPDPSAIDSSRPKTALRIIAEIAAIVSSILLAFAIDAAWDARQARSEEQGALSGLRADFLINRASLDAVLRVHRSRSKAYAWFQLADPHSIASITSDSATFIYRNLYAPFTFDAVRGNADALVSAGKLQLIRDQRLRAQLTDFIGVVEDAAEEAEYLRSSAQSVQEATIAYGGPWNPGGGASTATHLPRITAAHLASLRQDTRFMGLVGLGHSASTLYLAELEDVSALIDDILRSISGSLLSPAQGS